MNDHMIICTLNINDYFTGSFITDIYENYDNKELQ